MVMFVVFVTTPKTQSAFAAGSFSGVSRCQWATAAVFGGEVRRAEAEPKSKFPVPVPQLLPVP
jgi:hypothetical protein